ncbi:MAG: alpha/beta hydrolase [Rhodospirillaceae bacterium]|nr:alpha/beta hydrolase [Rhodospirillaceae bacterium]
MSNSIPFLINGPSGGMATIVLAHGAGAPMDSEFMEYIATQLALRSIKVVRFEFPFMAERRKGGSKRPPDSMPQLLSFWHTVLGQLGSEKNLFIGGKSLGGRIASMIADSHPVKGLTVLGYPFHPPGNPAKTRTSHMRFLKTPCLIVQGERDTLGNKTEVDRYRLSPNICIRWLSDGDHSFKPRKKSGRTLIQNWDEAVSHICLFLQKAVMET